VLQGIPLKDKGQTDSYQRIEAPVRGGEGAAGKIPDGGPPVTERQNSLDQLLIQNDQAQVRTRCTYCQSSCCAFPIATGASLISTVPVMVLCPQLIYVSDLLVSLSGI